MQKLKIDEDIRPLSEVRNGMANFIKQVHDTKRPVIITQHWKGVAVLLGANEFEAMQEKIELLSDIQTSLNLYCPRQTISGRKMDCYSVF
jgi:antitoxin YefM